MANSPSGPEAIKELEAQTDAFKRVQTSNADYEEVPNHGPVPTVKKRVEDAVEGNIARAETAAKTAAKEAAEAAIFAQRTSEDAATARQISGLDTVDQALAAREPGIVSKAMESLSGGMVVNRLDANGNWNVMVKIPVFTNQMVNDTLGTSWQPAEAVHPAFIRPDGTTMPWFEYAMYTASNDGLGNPVSAPHKDPFVSINFDSAKAKCKSMGSSWHLGSNAEWAAVAIWCLMNQYQPLGNTNYGQSHDKKFESGIRQGGALPGDVAGTARTLTGSGPDAWRHDKSMFGIADLVGNVWEWVDGLKTNEGQLIVADRNTDVEVDWVSQDAVLDAGNKLNSSKTAAANTNVTWSQLNKAEAYSANQLLQQLLIEPITGTDKANGRLYFNNDGERTAYRGGGWYYGASAGIAAIGLDDTRAGASNGIGLRPAYFE